MEKRKSNKGRRKKENKKTKNGEKGTEREEK